MLLENLIVKDIEEYGLLKFTPTTEAFLKKPASFQIVLNNKFEDANAEDDEDNENAGGQVGVAADDKLFEYAERSSDIRKQRKEGLPPFVLFLENSLQDMATLYPTTLKGIGKMPGRKCR